MIIMKPINSIDLALQLKEAASRFLNKKITVVSGYCKNKLETICQQSVLVSNCINTGLITDNNRPYFLSRIVTILQDFVRSLIGLLQNTIQKLLEILITTLWQSISNATGLPLKKFLLH